MKQFAEKDKEILLKILKTYQTVKPDLKINDIITQLSDKNELSEIPSIIIEAIRYDYNHTTDIDMMLYDNALIARLGITDNDIINLSIFYLNKDLTEEDMQTFCEMYDNDKFKVIAEVGKLLKQDYRIRTEVEKDLALRELNKSITSDLESIQSYF